MIVAGLGIVVQVPAGLGLATILHRNLRGTRISLPASRVTSQSPSSVGVMRVCFGEASTMASASSRVRTTNEVSCSRNTGTINGAVPSTRAPSSR